MKWLNTLYINGEIPMTISSLANFTVPLKEGTTQGLLMPKLSFRFRVTFTGFGTTNTTADDQLKIDVGVFNPLLGKGYGEIAAESRSNHKSQGFGSAKQRGTAIEFFSPVGGQTAKTDLFDGVNLNLDRNKGFETA